VSLRNQSSTEAKGVMMIARQMYAFAAVLALSALGIGALSPARAASLELNAVGAANFHYVSGPRTIGSYFYEGDVTAGIHLESIVELGSPSIFNNDGGFTVVSYDAEAIGSFGYEGTQSGVCFPVLAPTLPDCTSLPPLFSGVDTSFDVETVFTYRDVGEQIFLVGASISVRGQTVSLFANDAMLHLPVDDYILKGSWAFDYQNFDASFLLPTYDSTTPEMLGGAATGIFDVQYFGAPVPEPQTWLLLAVGVAAVAAMSRLRSRRAGKEDDGTFA